MFKVGDKVKVVTNSDFLDEYNKYIGTIATVIKVDNDIEFPEVLLKMVDNEELWYKFDELELVNNPLKIKLKLLSPTAVIPKYATEGAACFDLVADEDIIIQPGETKAISTGLAMEIPVGWKLSIKPRSGISLKTPLIVKNSPGTCDADFRGEIKVIMTNTSESPKHGNNLYVPLRDLSNNIVDQKEIVEKYSSVYKINRGDRIAQAELERVHQATFEIVDDLSETERGTGGFGHSGVR